MSVRRLVDYCRSKDDFGRVEIDPDPSGYWSLEILAAMTAVDLERDGCVTVTKWV